MATSFQVFVALVALATFSFLYGVVLDVPVQNELAPQAQQQADTAPAQEFNGYLSEIWRLLPAFATIAVVVWLFRQSVVGAVR